MIIKRLKSKVFSLERLYTLVLGFPSKGDRVKCGEGVGGGGGMESGVAVNSLA